MTVAHYIRMGTLGGLSARETMLTMPGQVFDLFELYAKANGLKVKGGEYD